jgi:hypothetical protein
MEQLRVEHIKSTRTIATGHEHVLLRIGLQSIINKFQAERFGAYADVLRGPGSIRILLPEHNRPWAIKLQGSGRPVDVADQLIRYAKSARYPSDRDSEFGTFEHKGWQLQIASVLCPHSEQTFMTALAVATWC